MARRISEDNPLQDRPYWARQKWESHVAFQHFQHYLEMPYGMVLPDGSSEDPQSRSLRKLADILGMSIATLSTHSKNWAWQERCRLYDEKVWEEKEAERQRVRQASARKQERLALQYKNDAADLYGEIFSKIRSMLSFPVAEEEIIEATDENGIPTGEVTRILKPAKWNFNTLSRLIKSLNDLGDIAAGRDNQGALDKLLERLDPATLTEEQRQQILDGEDIISVILSGGTTEIPDSGTARTGQPAEENDG